MHDDTSLSVDNIKLGLFQGGGREMLLRLRSMAKALGLHSKAKEIDKYLKRRS